MDMSFLVDIDAPVRIFGGLLTARCDDAGSMSSGLGAVGRQYDRGCRIGSRTIEEIWIAGTAPMSIV